MKNILFIMLLASLSSCSLLRKKDKTISEKETVLSEESMVQEIQKDSATKTTHTRITYGGTNPFDTPEAKLFANNLFNLSALKLPAGKLDSIINALKKDYNDFTKAGSAISGSKTIDQTTTEKKRSELEKNTSNKKELSEKAKEKHIESDSLFQSIPWYVYLIAIVGVLLFLAFKFDNPN